MYHLSVTQENPWALGQIIHLKGSWELGTAVPLEARAMPPLWKTLKREFNIEHDRACRSTGRANLLVLVLALKL